MRRYSDSTKGTGPGRRGGEALGRPFLAVLVCLVAMDPSRTTAEASPIKHHHVSAHSAPKATGAWESYLEKGPAYWSKSAEPNIDAHVRAVMAKALKGADPTENPNVQYLLWRRSLNATRFDHFHHRLGHTLQTMLPGTSSTPPQAQQLAPTTPTSTYPAPLSLSSVSTASDPGTSAPASSSQSTPQSILPPTDPGVAPAPAPIPEPETLTMAVVLLGAGVWWRFRNGLSQPIPG
jgi:hypothetical protein